ncbi:MAG: hypothetical protein ACPGYT_11885 [Nitrospirales bacterium]
MNREEIQGLRKAIALVASDVIMGDLRTLFDLTLTLIEEVDKLEVTNQAHKEMRMELEALKAENANLRDINAAVALRITDVEIENQRLRKRRDKGFGVIGGR